MFNKENFIKDFERNLFSCAGKNLTQADHRDIYYTLGNLIREYTGKPWADTNKLQEEKKAKSVYYFSMEFLTGKFMQKYLEYLGVYEIAREHLADNDICIADVFDVEPDPGLGNGGLGRLAAAFLDSLSCLGMPGHGYGLRYEKGLFRQKIVNGYQVEEADNWLAGENVWEYQRSSEELEVRFGGRIDVSGFGDDLVFTHVDYDIVKAVPYDTPVIGYLNGNVNTLRLWSAVSTNDLDFGEYAKGNLDGAFHRINEAKSICQVLYPDDTYYEGKKLRLKQEYFLVSAGVQDIVRKFKKLNLPITDFHDYVQIHINDTHPVMAIPELMRILMDSYGLEWNDAWEITVKTCAFTNHTIMEEAMEKWDNNLYREVIPRIWQITEEINNRFLFTLREEKKISAAESIERLSIINHGTVRMVNLAIAGSHSINGVARLHSDILKNRELKHFYDIYPEKFNNKTNGIIHRYWLMTSNPELSALIEELIGDRFKTDPLVLRELLKYSDDHEVLKKISSIKHINKQKLARYIYDTKGIKVNPYSIFDVQVKRIHEYKRQLMNVLYIIHLYGQLKDNPNLDIVPRTFIFAGKAAPGYYIAKEIIKLINTVADKINNDITIKDKIKVVFLENYSVTLASRLIPAADVSQQISTTTKEASGTSNMKFMMNGAITLATLDGANIEIMNEVGEENIVIFGMKENEVYDYYHKGNYDPLSIYHKNLDLKASIDKLVNGYFKVSYGEFQPIYDSLVKYGDRFFILKDFEDYTHAQEKINNLYLNKDRWASMSLANTASSGAFSSDYTILRYAKEIWGIESQRR